MNRRAFLLVSLAGFAGPAAARGQTARVPRIGWLNSGSASLPAHAMAFTAGLRDLGWVEGQNVVVEWRYAETKYENLPALAAELVELKVDVIVAVVNAEIRVLKQATSTIPIVMVAARDPVGQGFISSLARPGRNITGITADPSAEILGKPLELLKEAVPRMSRVGAVFDSALPGVAVYRKAAEDAAVKLNLKLLSVDAGTSNELDEAFTAITAWRAQGVLVNPSTFIFVHYPKIVGLAAKHKLPAVYTAREAVLQNGLMSYGANLNDLFRQAATYVDKILKGAKPADLPVEQPTKFELVINMKTAKALGLTIPQSLLLRADQVIE